MNKFERAHVYTRGWLTGAQYYQTLEAIEFAERYHVGTRKDGQTPEFYHQIGIVQHLITLLPGIREEFREPTLTVGPLHAILEDYDVYFEEVETRFGKQVACAVDALSRCGIMSNSTDTYKATDAYYNALSLNPIASVVKGADRVNNFQSMVGVFSEEKQKSYIEECEQKILPMLKRARKLFPDQQTVYENLKFSLNSQIDLIRAIHAAPEARAATTLNMRAADI